jgi:hypothetical protein
MVSDEPRKPLNVLPVCRSLWGASLSVLGAHEPLVCFQKQEIFVIWDAVNLAPTTRTPSGRLTTKSRRKNDDFRSQLYLPAPIAPHRIRLRKSQQPRNGKESMLIYKPELPCTGIPEPLIKSFILDIVNSADRSPDPDARHRFVKKYRDWLPVRCGQHQAEAESVYLDVINGWTAAQGDLQVEAPDEAFGFDVILPRYMERVIWSAAMSGKRYAAPFLEMMEVYFTGAVETGLRSASGRSFGYATNLHTSPLEPTDWHPGVLASLHWLRENLSRLKICGYSKCPTRYYVSDETARYCSDDCKVMAERARRQVRRELHQPLKDFTPEGRQAISRAQIARWAEKRAAKMQLAGTPRRSQGNFF